MARVQPLPNPGTTSQPKLLNVIDFNGGLNTTANRFDLQPNETPDCSNVDIDRRGGIIRRAAATTSNDANTTITGVPYIYGQGTQGEALYFANRVFTSLSHTGSSVTFGSKAWAATGPTVFSFGLFLGTPAVSYITNSSYKDSTLATWTGVGRFQDSFSSPSGTHLPDARAATSHLGYAFVGYTAEYQSGTVGVNATATINYNRLRWSHPGDGGSWRTDDYIDVGYKFDPIVAVISCGDHLLILKNASTWALHGYDADTFNLVNISNVLGCAGSSAATRAPTGGVYFFDTRKGLCVYEGGAVRLLSEKISSYFPAYTPPTVTGYDSTLSYGEYDTVTVGYSTETDRVWVSLPDSTSRATDPPTNAFSLVYDPTTGAWTKNNIKARCYFVWRGKLHGVWLDKTFYVEDKTATRDTYLGTTDHIDGYWVSPWFNAGQPVTDKRFTKPEFVLTGNQTGTFTVSVYKNYDPTTVEKTITISATNPLAVSTDYDQVFRTQVIGNAKAVALKFAGPTSEHVLWRLDGYTMKYKLKAVRS